MKAHFLKSHHNSLSYSPHDQTTSRALSQVTARWAELAAEYRRKFQNLTALNVRLLCVYECARARRRVCVCDEGHAPFIADISMRSDLQNKISTLCGKQLRMAKVSTTNNPPPLHTHTSK
jgi:hypothetical protein